MHSRSKVVRVDADVFAKLQELAEPGENPNNVLRRLFNLEPVKAKRSDVLRPWDRTEVAA